MNYSFSTVLMTILASNLVIILITLCFRFEKLLLTIGYRLLAVFLVLTLVRFVFPFELPFAKNVYLPTPISSIVSFLRHPLFGQQVVANKHTPVLSLWFLLECTWLIGFVVKLIQHILNYLHVSRFILKNGCDISRQEPVQNILKKVCVRRHKHFHVSIIPGLKTPQIFGILSPRILVPSSVNLSEEDWYFTLQHEAFHFFHHDLIIKETVNLLCILYWWNPACKTFKKQVELLLEMHVDDSLSCKDPHTISAYLHTLLRIAESVTDDTLNASSLTIAAIGKNEDELVKRFQMLCRKNSRAKLPVFLGFLVTVVTIYACSYLFILESSTIHIIETTSNTLDLTEGFHAIPNVDGSFGIYYNDILIETVNSLKYYSEIPILSPN